MPIMGHAPDVAAELGVAGSADFLAAERSPPEIQGPHCTPALPGATRQVVALWRLRPLGGLDDRGIGELDPGQPDNAGFVALAGHDQPPWAPASSRSWAAGRALNGHCQSRGLGRPE